MTATFAIPDRAGQAWKHKPGRGIGDGRCTILRRVRLRGQELHEAEALDWRGRRFTFTTSEAVLRQRHIRDRERDRS